jgi:5-methyltetrahydrofolate--homocysteine methyltransferase
MLKRIADEKMLTAKAVFGFFPAASRGDDVILHTDDSRKQPLTTLHFIRQ